MWLVFCERKIIACFRELIRSLEGRNRKAVDVAEHDLDRRFDLPEDKLYSRIIHVIGGCR